MDKFKDACAAGVGDCFLLMVRGINELGWLRTAGVGKHILPRTPGRADIPEFRTALLIALRHITGASTY